MAKAVPLQRLRNKAGDIWQIGSEDFEEVAHISAHALAMYAYMYATRLRRGCVAMCANRRNLLVATSICEQIESAEQRKSKHVEKFFSTCDRGKN